MFIDEKGRLFGLINLLDLIVVIGALILVYLGISVYIVFKVGTPKLKDFSPKQIYQNERANLTLRFDNNRVLSSVDVRLIPHDFKGEIRQYPCNVGSGKVNRDVVDVNIPAKLVPGKYEVELQIITEDAFRRRSFFQTRLSDSFLTVIPPPESPDTIAKEYIKEYSWPVELEVFFPAARETKRDKIRTGDEMTDSTGQPVAKVESVRESRSTDTLNLTGLPWWKGSAPYRGGQTARLKLEIEKIDRILKLQETDLEVGNRLKFWLRQKEQTGYILGYMFPSSTESPQKFQELEADVILLALDKTQLPLIKPGAKQEDSTGQVLAQVIQVFDQSRRPAISQSGPSLTDDELSNLIVRMKLLCENRQGRLFYQNVLVQAGALVLFELNGQKISGSITQDIYPVTFNVCFPIVLWNVVPQLQKNTCAYTPNSNKLVARIDQVLDVVDNSYPFTMEDLKEIDLNQKYSQVFVRMELYCTLNNGQLLFMGQNITYGKKYNFSFPIADLEGVIWYGQNPPPPRKLIWKDIIIEFESLRPEIADLLKSGMQEEVEGRPVNMIIEGVISNKKSKWSENQQDVRCRVRMKVVYDGQRYYYQGAPLYIGSKIAFQTSQLSITSGVLVSFGT